MIPRDTERPRTIALKTDAYYEEGRAEGAILPGQVIMLVASDSATPSYPMGVVVNTANGTATGMRIAIEHRLGNNDSEKRYGNSVDDAYAADDIVPFYFAQPGDVFLLRVPDNAEYEVGDKLEATGNGNFEAVSAGVALAEVEEYYDAPNVSANSVLVRCRIL